ncbi:MAG: hypothetical protein ACOXZH_07930 [Bacteroidales bacterium]|jgi:hypothetical protein|nr:hypothetical protein [Bacteroidales bacterium]
MKRYIILFVILFVVIGAIVIGLAYDLIKSTWHTEVLYTYKNISILRVSYPSKTSFYYYKNNKKINGKIITTYSGINNGFSGYLCFHSNNKISILSGDGYFKVIDIDTTLFNYQRIYAYNRPILGDTICIISSYLEQEKEENSKLDLNINIIYKNNLHNYSSW